MKTKHQMKCSQGFICNLLNLNNYKAEADICLMETRTTFGLIQEQKNEQERIQEIVYLHAAN